MTSLSEKRVNYIPDGAILQDAYGTDSEIHFYDNADGRPSMVAFHGRKERPTKRGYFGSAEKRSGYVCKYIQKRKKYAEDKVKRATARKQPHNFKVGDILYSSWGYEQTNLYFYQVTRIVSNRRIEIRDIARRDVSAYSWASGEAVAVKDSFTSGALVFLVTEGSIKFHSSCYASLWDGKPKYWSSYA